MKSPPPSDPATALAEAILMPIREVGRLLATKIDRLRERMDAIEAKLAEYARHDG